MKKQTLRIAASAATVGVMSIVGFGMVAHAEPNPISAVGQSFHGMFHRHGGRGPSPESVSAIASVLNLTEAQLKTEVQSGKTLADIATAQNVSVQSVIDAVANDMKTHVASDVASGAITQTEADTKLADVVARATDMVNGVRPTGMPGDKVGGMGGGKGGPGHRGHGDDGDDDGEGHDEGHDDGGAEDGDA